MTRESTIKLGAGIAIIAAMAGVVPTVYGMVKAFNQLEASDAVNSEELSTSISMSLHLSLIAMPVAAIGIAILIAGLFMKPKKRNSTT